MAEFQLLPILGVGFKSRERREKLVAAVSDLHAVVNTQESIDWFMSQKFTQLGEHKNKTNDQLLILILRSLTFNYSVIERSWWKRFSSVIGYSMDNVKTKGPDIFTYADSFDSMSVAGLAGHLFHESLHALSMHHEFKWSRERDFSVPYAFGNFIESLVQKRRQQLNR